jgi:phosphoserine phosphatase
LELILVRHGETDWNVQEIFRGRADVELNSTGKKQAELLAQYLKNIKLDAVYTSPLERALRTAQIVTGQQHRLQPEPMMELNDFDFGEWQAMSKADVKEKYPDILDRWQKDPQRARIPGGESLNDVKKRVQKAVKDIVSRHEEGSVLIVSHRIILKAIILNLLGLDLSHFNNIRVDNVGVTSFGYEKGDFVLLKHNDACFLKATGKIVSPDF